MGQLTGQWFPLVGWGPGHEKLVPSHPDRPTAAITEQSHVSVHSCLSEAGMESLQLGVSIMVGPEVTETLNKVKVKKKDKG